MTAEEADQMRRAIEIIERRQMILVSAIRGQFLNWEHFSQHWNKSAEPQEVSDAPKV